MRKQQGSLLAIVTLVVAIVVGCSNSTAATTEHTPDSASATAEDSRHSTLDTPAGRQLLAVANVADQFVSSEFPYVGPVGRWFFVPADMYAESPCGNQYDDTSLYCEANGTVYIGEQLATDAERIVGQTALYIIAGFEIGRHVQTWYRNTGAGVPPQLPTLQDARAVDVQADCYAGSLAKYAREQGAINDPLQVDPRPLYAVIASTGDRAGTLTTDPQKRYLQFYIGALDGAHACNSYYVRP